MNREEILSRFEAWLDGALAAEDPPGGLDADILSALSEGGAEATEGHDRHPDLHTMWEAMTALTHEVKLQGRAFKTLDSTLGTQASRIADEMRVMSREREREVQREAERQGQRRMIGVLIDVRDRLERGLESVRAIESATARSVRRRWLAPLMGAPGGSDSSGTLAAVIKGYGLGIDHLDQTLGDLNVRRIICEGQVFDPHLMNAIDKEASTAVPEGTVLDVYRSGYEWNGEVFRPAQVKVSVAPATRESYE